MVAITALMSLGFIFGITSAHFQQDGLIITFLVVHLALALVIFLLRVLMDEQVCFLVILFYLAFFLHISLWHLSLDQRFRIIYTSTYSIVESTPHMN